MWTPRWLCQSSFANFCVFNWFLILLKMKSRVAIVFTFFVFMDVSWEIFATLVDTLLLESLSLFFFFFLGPHTWHMGVPRLGIEWELAAAGPCHSHRMPDPRPRLQPTLQVMATPVLNPLSEARGRTRIPRILARLIPLSHDRNSFFFFSSPAVS